MARQVRHRCSYGSGIRRVRFIPTDIRGVVEIEIDPHNDERGFFARIFCPHEFAAAGIDFTSTQIDLSRNVAALTLRGMHYQDAPFAEAKLVRVTTGSVHDVVVDLRRNSPTFRRWIARRLSAMSANALFV